MNKRASPAWLEGVFLLLFIALLVWQLLLPGFIGMADNGDFAKIAGRFCLADADHEAGKFEYFEPDFVRGPASCYNPHIPSSEFVPARLAATLVRTLGNKTSFDIRWLGGLHVLIFTAVYYLVLFMLRPFPLVSRIVLSLIAVWIFDDVGYAAYLNTFYSDVPAMLGGPAAIFLAVLLARSRQITPALLGLFGASALFFVTSKAQHGIYGLIPASAAVWLGWRARDWRTRLMAGCVAAALSVGMLWVIGRTPAWYTAQSRFNLIYSKIAAASHTPEQDLRELGLDGSGACYAGMNSFMPGSPMLQEKFRNRFAARTSYWRVALFYFRHPARAAQIMASDLRNEAPQRRLYSNFPRSYGQPPYAQTKRFATWSSWRIWLFRRWPGHILIWYALAIGSAVWLALYQPSRFGNALLWTIVAVALVAIAEFCVASLADSGETARHLWMFHVFTDTTIYLALVFAVSRLWPAAMADHIASPPLNG